MQRTQAFAREAFGVDTKGYLGRPGRMGSAYAKMSRMRTRAGCLWIYAEDYRNITGIARAAVSLWSPRSSTNTATCDFNQEGESTKAKIYYRIEKYLDNIGDESDRRAGLREKRCNYQAVCYFSTTESAIDLSAFKAMFKDIVSNLN